MTVEPMDVDDCEHRPEEYNENSIHPEDPKEDPQEQEVDMEPPYFVSDSGDGGDDDDDDNDEDEEPEEEDAEEEPMERRVIELESSGVEGGHYPQELREMMLQLGFTRRPVYYLKIVPRLGRDEWSVSVTLFDGMKKLTTHNSPTPRSNREEAIIDAAWDAWEAITAVSKKYEQELKGTVYGYYPCGARGEKTLSVSLVEYSVPRHHTASQQKALVRMSARLMRCQEELRVSQECMKELESRINEDQAAEETWTATSPDRAPEIWPPVDSRRILEPPSPAGSTSSRA